MTIENLEKQIVSKCHCDWCEEPTCRFSKCFVPSQALPGRFGIPTDRCPNIKGLVEDEQLDVALRIWVKESLIEGKGTPFPFEFTEAGKREWMKNAMPVSAHE